MEIMSGETKVRVRVCRQGCAPAIRVIIIARLDCSRAVGHLANAAQVVAGIIVADTIDLLAFGIVPPNDSANIGAASLPFFQHLRPGPDELLGGHGRIEKPLRMHGLDHPPKSVVGKGAILKYADPLHEPIFNIPLISRASGVACTVAVVIVRKSPGVPAVHGQTVVLSGDVPSATAKIRGHNCNVLVSCRQVHRSGKDFAFG